MIAIQKITKLLSENEKLAKLWFDRLKSGINFASILSIIVKLMILFTDYEEFLLYPYVHIICI